jgi:vitamin K-dependent gamma-carboxylase
MTVTERVHRPVDAASVAVFRIAFGALLLIATLRYFAHGWIAEYYETPTHFFTYYGFSWVKAHPYMHLHFAVMAVLAVMIAIGLYYRFAVVGFGALFAYAHLIDKTNYLNHYFLIIWLCVLMAVLPLHRVWSVDRYRARRRSVGETVPAYVVWALRSQLAAVYLFGGIAKLSGDWLCDAQPLQIWLAANTDFPVIGGLFDQPWVAYVFSYAGVIFDLTIVPLLLWGRTRRFAYVLVIAFHLITAQLFPIGMFPWVMIAGSLLFLAPDWPRRWLGRRAVRPVPERRSRVALPVLAIWFSLQLLVPLRHHLYTDDVLWTEEGFRFSWQVMVMEKQGSATYRVREPSTGRTWKVRPTQYLTRYQARMMATQPDMILELAHVIAGDFRSRGVRDPEVRVDAFASLDGRPSERLIDPSIDLAAEPEGLGAKSWILPRSSR